MPLSPNCSITSLHSKQPVLLHCKPVSCSCADEGMYHAFFKKHINQYIIIMKQFTSTKLIAGYILGAGILLYGAGCAKKKDAVPPILTITTFATGFASPNGIATDQSGNVWVADQGTGKNDGKIWVIKPGGEKSAAIVNLESFVVGADLDGPSHLLFADNLLYFLGARGKMYKAAIAGFSPGSPPISVSSLGVEDIGSFVMTYPFVKNTHQTHPYGITKAPDGSFYITDAAANALLRRSPAGVYSVVAEVPGISNPLPYGPPMVESVPTSVLFDDGRLLVTTLLGFPFPPGKAIIYQVTTSGQVSIFQQGFTSLVDIVKGEGNERMVVEHGVFGTMGFTKNTGRLVWANGQTTTPFVTELNLPVGLVQADDHTWYVTSLGDKSVLKIVYQ